MKKKLLAILTVLVICLTPAFMMVGCGGSSDSSVIIAPGGVWTAYVGESYSSMKEGQGFKISYFKKDWNPEVGKMQYVTTDGGFSEEPVYFEITTAAEAFASGGMVASGYNASTLTEGTNRTMQFTFGGQTFTVEYEVVERGASGGSGNGGR